MIRAINLNGTVHKDEEGHLYVKSISGLVVYLDDCVGSTVALSHVALSYPMTEQKLEKSRKHGTSKGRDQRRDH